MLRFYWSLIREIPAVLRNSAEAWAFWILTIGAPAVVLLNPQLQQRINTPQFSRWFVLVPIALSVFYGMLRVNHRLFLEVSAERDRALESVRQLQQRPPITRDDWMAMADEFKTLLDRRVRATWSKGEPRDSWSLIGDREVVDRMNSLCKRAGTMLSASPRIAAKLSDSVLAHSEPADRWLQFMREHGAVLTVAGPQPPGGFQTGTYESLPTTCSRVCIDCSTEEI